MKYMLSAQIFEKGFRTILAHKYKSNFPTKIGPFLGSKKNSFGNPTNDTTNVDSMYKNDQYHKYMVRWIKTRPKN